jgi:hypothetical protein
LIVAEIGKFRATFAVAETVALARSRAKAEFESSDEATIVA